MKSSNRFEQLSNISFFSENPLFSDILADPNVKKPENPVLFFKPSTTYITEGQDIVVSYEKTEKFKRSSQIQFLFLGHSFRKP